MFPFEEICNVSTQMFSASYKINFVLLCQLTTFSCKRTTNSIIIKYLLGLHVLLVNKLPYKFYIKEFVIDISGDSRVKLVVEIFDTF